MGLHKILKIVAGLLGIAGLIFLILLVAKGDEAIRAAALMGDTSAVDPMAYIAYITLAVVLFFVLVFVLKNLVSNPATLKSALKNIGAFVVLFLVSYFVLAKGVETPLRDGNVLSEGASKLVGAGLYLFYILVIIAAGLMLFSGLKRMLNR